MLPEAVIGLGNTFSCSMICQVSAKPYAALTLRFKLIGTPEILYADKHGVMAPEYVSVSRCMARVQAM